MGVQASTSIKQRGSGEYFMASICARLASFCAAVTRKIFIFVSELFAKLDNYSQEI